jgi:hypothetical protein
MPRYLRVPVDVVTSPCSGKFEAQLPQHALKIAESDRSAGVKDLFKYLFVTSHADLLRSAAFYFGCATVNHENLEFSEKHILAN